MEKVIELLKNEKQYLKNKVFRFKEDLETITEIDQALQLLQTDVIYQLCECGGNERVALDCTSKNCRHPKYNKK